MKNLKKRMATSVLLLMMVFFLMPSNLSFLTVYASEEMKDGTIYIVDNQLKYYIPNGNTTGYYQIGTADDLNTLAKVVNQESVTVVVINKNGEEILASIEAIPNQNAKLMNHIDATEVVLNAIGTSVSPYNGTFDGNNYTITVSNYSGSALFDFVGNTGIIKNVIIETKGMVIANNEASHYALLANSNTGLIDCCITKGTMSKTSGLSGTAEIAGIVCENRGIIRNCVNNTNMIISGESMSNKSDFLFTAGICARNVGGKLENSSNTGNITIIGGPSVRIAGIVAELASGTTANCSNSGTIVQSGMAGNCRTAGVIAQITDLNKGVSGVSVSNCVNTGTITGTLAVGGVVGNAAGISTAEDIIITNCYNTGNVVSTGGYAGGVVMQAKYVTILKCTNIGNISSEGVNTAGILGGSGTVGNVIIRNCYNHGTIRANGEASSNAIAGIIGQACTSCIVSNCYNDGDVTGDHNVGGIVGLVATSGDNVLISDCYNCGQVTAILSDADNNSYCVGGIVGLWSNSTKGGKLERCYSANHVIYKRTTVTEDEKGTSENGWSGYVIGKPVDDVTILTEIGAYRYSAQDWTNKVNALNIAFDTVENAMKWDKVLNSLYYSDNTIYIPWNTTEKGAVCLVQEVLQSTVTPVLTSTPTPSVTVTPVPTVSPIPTVTIVPTITTIPGMTFIQSGNEIILDKQGKEVTSLIQIVGTTNQLSIANLSVEEKVVWESTNKNVVEIDEHGNVIMKHFGMAELIAAIGEGEKQRTETIVVIVEEEPEIKNDPVEALEYIRLGTSWNDIPLVRTLFLGEHMDIDFWGVKSWMREKYEYYWESSDETVMTTDEVGYIQANSSGVATLSLKLKNKETGNFLNVESMQIVVPENTEAPILLGTSSSYTFDSLMLRRNERVDLNFYGVENWREEAYEYQWTSSEPTVVWVDNVGNLTPVQAGKAIITLTMMEKETGNPLYVMPVEVMVVE